jgi:hypothetical protein
MLASPLMRMVNGTQIESDGGQEESLMDRARERADLNFPSTNARGTSSRFVGAGLEFVAAPKQALHGCGVMPS